MAHDPRNPSLPIRIELQAGYERWAASYDDADPSTLLDEPVLLELMGDVAGCRALDLGCGTGRYARLLIRRGTRVVGMDLSMAMLSRARSATGADAARWLQGQVERLPFVDAAFEMVVSGLVVDHVENLRAFFGEVRRVLRPGGRAIITAVHPEIQRITGPSVAFAAEGAKYQIPANVHQVAEIVGAAEGAGLLIEQQREPRITAAIVERQPAWRDRLNQPGLLILAAKRG